MTGPTIAGRGERRRPQRNDLRKEFRRREQRSDRPARRPDHRVGGAEHEREDEQRPHRCPVDLAVDEEARRHAGDPGEQEERRDPPAVESVGHPAAHQHQQHGGNELREPDESDVERVAGDVEGLLEQHRDQDVQTRPQRAPSTTGTGAPPGTAGRPERWPPPQPTDTGLRPWEVELCLRTQLLALS